MSYLFQRRCRARRSGCDTAVVTHGARPSVSLRRPQRPTLISEQHASQLFTGIQMKDSLRELLSARTPPPSPHVYPLSFRQRLTVTLILFSLRKSPPPPPPPHCASRDTSAQLANRRRRVRVGVIMASVISERPHGLSFVSGGPFEGFSRRKTGFVNRACFTATLNYHRQRQTADKEMVDLMTSCLLQNMLMVKVHYFIIGLARPIGLPPPSTSKQYLSVYNYVQESKNW